MDNKDKLLIKILEKEGKLSSRQLAKKAMLPISTAYRRVNRMEKEGVIKGYRAIVNYEKTDKPIPILAFINLEETNKEENYVPVKEIKENLEKINHIYQLFEIQGGDWDIILKARLEKLKDTNKLMEKIRSIPGIEEVKSSIITEEVLF
ncbi:MAG: winged helix-turn-helix transcriptional regulator [Candidatus Aenigmarchaeota archaeon]|nr:winged helix-turn-helix transcriptional regulator [Candidatus Aenigmarchaeota archaeon]